MTRYAVVTVTFNPALDVLRRQLATLEGASQIVVVDNASVSAHAVRTAVEAVPRASFVGNESNTGLAAALNLGARFALDRQADCEYLLFLDQDTEPGAQGAAALVEAAQALRVRDPRAGLFGPLMVDAVTGLDHGIHVIRGWRWTRVHPRAGESAPLRCASINGSGMVVPATVFRESGGFEESLFIDYVDAEYSFRLTHRGYDLYALPNARFLHRMGERSVPFWLAGWRVWPHRSPQRHYYLFRNAMRLLRRPYVPRVWKFWAVPKLILTALVHGCGDKDRVAQLRAMASGFRQGARCAVAK